mgnify:CR=1 FL=1
MSMNKGNVVQVIGPVVDIEFAPEQLPDLLTAIQIKGEVEGNPIDLTLEAAQHRHGFNRRFAARYGGHRLRGSYFRFRWA